ncbi:MAG: hypothetical protein GF349_01480 [Candidatus Magasanikbacteria bacterium]|nr:hypothetical protein [Candidatus Magasanikbacteria bacterium]
MPFLRKEENYYINRFAIVVDNKTDLGDFSNQDFLEVLSLYSAQSWPQPFLSPRHVTVLREVDSKYGGGKDLLLEIRSFFDIKIDEVVISK